MSIKDLSQFSTALKYNCTVIFHYTYIPAHSASDLLESTSKSQFDGTVSSGNSCSSVFSTKDLVEEKKDKLYPIPPRRTKKVKIRSRSSSAITSLEQVGSQLTDKKEVPAVSKRPLAEQLSNPELTRKVKPPRPPPPNRQIPPRTYVHPDSKTKQLESNVKADKRGLVVIDTRGQRRQRYNRSPQPERPPLPYETFVLQKQPSPSHTNNRRHSADRIINDSVAAVKGLRLQEEDQVTVSVLVTPPPAKYEEVALKTAAAGLRKSSVSDNIHRDELSTTSHPFPGQAVRGRETATGVSDRNKVGSLANRRNEHRESIAVPYEVPSIRSKGEMIAADGTHVKDSATVPSSESAILAKQQQLQETENDNLEGAIYVYSP